MKILIEVIRAKHLGFCFGVDKAVKLANQLSKEENQKKIYILGEIVHNSVVVEDLKNKGVELIEETDVLTGELNIPQNSIIIIRAHGIEKRIFDKLREYHFEIKDATCPFVSAIKNKLLYEEKKGQKIIFLGDRYHPEVRGIISYGTDVTVVNGLEELKKINIDSNQKYSLLTQTTLNQALFQEVNDYILKNHSNIEVFNQICTATSERQEATKELAAKVDVVLVLGGTNSSNTKKLFEVSKQVNPKTYLIHTTSDFKKKLIEGAKKVGISAGASTPEITIKKIEDLIGGVNNDRQL